MGHIKSGDRHEVEYLARQLLDLAPKDAWAVLYGWVKEDKIACSVMRTLALIIENQWDLTEVKEYMAKLSPAKG